MVKNSLLLYLQFHFLLGGAGPRKGAVNRSLVGVTPPLPFICQQCSDQSIL